VKLIISDLDGTLLDHHSYRWEAAAPALAMAREAGTPVVLCTSKTWEEAAWWQAQLGLSGQPAIVENGGAIHWGDGTVEALGAGYAELRNALGQAARASGAEVKGFGDMTVEEVMQWCAIGREQAERARRRGWDEPFVVTNEERVEALRAAIERQGLQYSRGGRFHHIHGRNDKAAAARRVIERYGGKGAVRSLGLGDGLNDASFLREVDVAVLMPSPLLEALRGAVPHGTVAPAPGPAGWCEAVRRFLAE
jgi:mannosyl-3-phosphoglycerate phosphatase